MGEEVGGERMGEDGRDSSPIIPPKNKTKKHHPEADLVVGFAARCPDKLYQ